MHRNSRLLILAACFATLPGAAGAQGTTKAGHRPPAKKSDSPDAWLTTKVKMALLTTKDVPAMAINVDTVHDVVTLSGKVSSDAEKTRAGEVAKGVEGVKEVKNILQVVPASRKDVVDKADDQIKDALKKRLDADKGLSGINLSSVDKGVVLLSGKATAAAALRALQTARATPGVRGVSSEIALTEK
jgi:hyperosmotically inducible protein